VATGHTEDDQVETVMLNMDRGAGTYGLAGMWPERAFPRPGAGGLRLARPLLCVARDETRAYCAARGLAFFDDETNDDPAFARNRIRAMLAGAYEETPEARGLLLQLAVTTRARVRTLEASMAGAAPCTPAECRRALAFDRDALRAVPEELRIYAWRPALERLLGDARDFGRGHFETLARAPAARTGSTFELPRGVVVTVDARRVLVSIGRPGEPALEPGWERPLPFSGRAGAWEVVVTAACDDQAPDEDRWQSAELTADGGAVLRAWRPGDRVALAGGRGHRKLQDAYVDAKVPQRQRASAPVLAVAGAVLWTPLIGAASAPAAAGRVRWSVRWRRCGDADDSVR
jgi:tRNA(Ile)-lysidine synthase